MFGPRLSFRDVDEADRRARLRQESVESRERVAARERAELKRAHGHKKDRRLGRASAAPPGQPSLADLSVQLRWLNKDGSLRRAGDGCGDETDAEAEAELGQERKRERKQQDAVEDEAQMESNSGSGGGGGGDGRGVRPKPSSSSNTTTDVEPVQPNVGQRPKRHIVIDDDDKPAASAAVAAMATAASSPSPITAAARSMLAPHPLADATNSWRLPAHLFPRSAMFPPPPSAAVMAEVRALACPSNSSRTARLQPASKSGSAAPIDDVDEDEVVIVEKPPAKKAPPPPVPVVLPEDDGFSDGDSVSSTAPTQLVAKRQIVVVEPEDDGFDAIDAAKLIEASAPAAPPARQQPQPSSTALSLSRQSEQQDEEEHKDTPPPSPVNKQRAVTRSSSTSSTSYNSKKLTSIMPPSTSTTTSSYTNTRSSTRLTRSVSTTSPDASDPSLAYTPCQWVALFHRLIDQICGEEDKRVNAKLREFCFALGEDKRAECGRFAQYGDLCPLHADRLLGVRVGLSTARGAGMGLFTTWRRVKGETVCEYKGAVRLQSGDDDAEGPDSAQYRGEYAIDLPRCTKPPYRAGRGQGWVVDASRSTDGFARYCNDFSLGLAKRKALCNCVFRPGVDCVPLQDEECIFLQANEDIEAGEELSVDYGNMYWTKDTRGSALLHQALTLSPQPHLVGLTYSAKRFALTLSRACLCALALCVSRRILDQGGSMDE